MLDYAYCFGRSKEVEKWLRSALVRRQINAIRYALGRGPLLLAQFEDPVEEIPRIHDDSPEGTQQRAEQDVARGGKVDGADQQNLDGDARRDVDRGGNDPGSGDRKRIDQADHHEETRAKCTQKDFSD